MKVLVLFDLGEAAPADQNYDAFLRAPVAEEWTTEASLIKTLTKLGHEARPFGIFDSFEPLLAMVKEWRPDVIFNLAEAFRGDRAHEPDLASLFELLGVAYTGARPLALGLCKDKALAKNIAASAGARVPRFEVSRRGRPLTKLGEFPYPAIVKPLELESSAGISQDSFAGTEKQALERARFVHQRLEQDAIIEEYIEGREIYVGVLGEGSRVETLPPRELFFESVPDGDPKFATFKAKWDENYRRKWGIRNGAAKPMTPELYANLSDVSKRIYQALGLSGYARLDLRVTKSGEIVFLEANPNPGLAPGDEFVDAASSAGLGHEKLVARVLEDALRKARREA